MIALLTKDGRLRDFVESVLSEHQLTITLPDAASLFIVDLDTEAIPRGREALRISSSPFVDCELTRPFLQEELIALCKSRLGGQPTVAKIVEKPIEGLTLGEGFASYRGEKIALTPAEFRLLSLFVANRGEMVPLADCERVCRVRASSGNSVSVTVASLRKKLDYRFGERFFLSRRGEGYCLIK